MQEKSDLPQDTLDLLILKVVASARCMGTRSRNAWNRFRAVWSRSRKARFIRRCTGSKTVAFLQRIGRKPRAGVRQSSIA
jgi:hypothetical protein